MLSANLNLVLVEGNVVLDVVCLFFRFGVVPRDVWDGFALNGGIVVRSGSFPWADGACLGISEEGFVD